MKFLTTNWVSRALGLPKDVDRELSQITSDTRDLRAGSLFVALKGEASDGHDHVAKAQAAGAAALVHRQGTPCPEGMLSFPVHDTLEAWRSLAGAWRREFEIPIAVVAGSAGKTTSKEFLAALFRGKYKNVLHTLASQNGFQGVPTTLLRLSAEHDAAVIEVGIDEPGSMIQHLELVAPDAGVLTSIGPEHLEKLGDLETVEKEEGLLFAVLAIRGGLAAVNLDDEAIVRQAEQLPESQRVTYSLKTDARVRGHLSVGDNDEIWIDVEGLSKAHDRFRVPLEGTHNARNLLGALTLAHGLGLSVTELYKGLLTFKAPPGRSEVHHWKGCKVLADTYNANPSSVEAALETLFGAGEREGETWVCLGDMLELGNFEESMHRGLATPLLKYGVKHIFLYGPRMKNLERELRERKFAGTLAHFESQELMAERLRKSAKDGDRILIKGSRGMRMENVWKALQIG